jgi:hypothetical protein
VTPVLALPKTWKLTGTCLSPFLSKGKITATLPVPVLSANFLPSRSGPGAWHGTTCNLVKMIGWDSQESDFLARATLKINEISENHVPKLPKKSRYNAKN